MKIRIITKGGNIHTNSKLCRSTTALKYPECQNQKRNQKCAKPQTNKKDQRTSKKPQPSPPPNGLVSSSTTSQIKTKLQDPKFQIFLPIFLHFLGNQTNPTNIQIKFYLPQYFQFCKNIKKGVTKDCKQTFPPR